MQKYTKAMLSPIVEVRVSVDPAPGTKDANVEIKFLGKTHSYQVPIKFVAENFGF